MNTAGTMALNAATTLLNFVLALILARFLGTDGYGSYAFALAWATVLSVPAGLGLPALVVRSTAAYTTRAEFGLLRGFLRWANQLASASSLIVLVAAASVGLAVEHASTDARNAFLIGLALVPVISLTTVRQSALQGLGRVLLGRVPETVVSPALFLALAVAAHAALDESFTATWAVALNVAAAIVALGAGALILRRSLPALARRAPPSYEMRLWLPTALRLLAASILLAVSNQLGTILLGLLERPADAGVFNVAQRGALFVSFVSLAASYPLMPLVARLHASGDAERLQRTLARAARMVLVFSVPIAVVLVVLSGSVMRLFGTGFSEGADVMQILVAGELSALLCGFGGVALVMTGHERVLTWAVALRVAATLLLSIALIPLWGATGAAVGAATGAVLSNACIAWLAWRYLGIYAPAIRLPPRHT